MASARRLDGPGVEWMDEGVYLDVPDQTKPLSAETGSVDFGVALAPLPEWWEFPRVS